MEHRRPFELFLLLLGFFHEGFANVHFFHPPILDVNDTFIERQWNSTLELGCVGKYPLSWQIYKGNMSDSRLLISSSVDPSQPVNKHKSTLKLKDLDVSDSGYYGCFYQGTTDDDNITYVEVSVHANPSIVVSVRSNPFIDVSEAQNPVVNGTFTLKCTATVSIFSDSTIDWDYPNKIEMGSRINQTKPSFSEWYISEGELSEDIISYLTVTEAQSTDSGRYTCTATDGWNGELRTEVTIFVSSFANVHFFHPPIIDVNDIIIERQQKSTLELVCVGKYPLSWRIGSSKADMSDSRLLITSSVDPSQPVNKHKSTLRLKDLDFDDSVPYWCFYQGTTGYYSVGNTTVVYVRIQEIVCPALAAPANGLVIPSDRRYGSTEYYFCDRYYKLVGDSERECLINGLWSGNSPVCEKITCKAPDKFPNGRIIGKKDTVYNAEDILIFRCNDGVTHSTSECLENGEWNHSPPTCPDILVTEDVQTAHYTTDDILVTEDLQTAHYTTDDIVKTEANQTAHYNIDDILVTEDVQTAHYTTDDILVTEDVQTAHYITDDIVLTKANQTAHYTTDDILVTEDVQTGHYTTDDIVLNEANQTAHYNIDDILVTEDVQTAHYTTDDILVTEDVQTAHYTTDDILVTEDVETAHYTTDDILVTEDVQTAHYTTDDIVLTKTNQTAHYNIDDILLTKDVQTALYTTAGTSEFEDVRTAHYTDETVNKRQNRVRRNRETVVFEDVRTPHYTDAQGHPQVGLSVGAICVIVSGVSVCILLLSTALLYRKRSGQLSSGHAHRRHDESVSFKNAI